MKYQRKLHGEIEWHDVTGDVVHENMGRMYVDPDAIMGDLKRNPGEAIRGLGAWFRRKEVAG